MSIVNFAYNKHSQNGEDGILKEVFYRLQIHNGKCCEFGSHDGYFCSNTRLLVELGWQGVFMDAIHGQFITPENVNDLVPANLDLLSIDIDGNDYLVWQAYEGQAKVVIIEINSSLNPDNDYFTEKTGSNFSIMNKLAEKKGYKLLCHTGNCIYIKDEYFYLFPDADNTFIKTWLQV